MPHQSSEEIAANLGLPMDYVSSALVGYRSVGIGIFGAAMRWAGMPLEKIALYMNSSQITGSNQFAKAMKLTFQEGYLAPYRVVGPASLTAWFMQYSVMGVAFQFFDRTLSNLLGVRPMYYGKELMEPPEEETAKDWDYQARNFTKTLLSPVLAACLESYVSNRAEGQRYFGPAKFQSIEKASNRNLLIRAAGPAFGANAARNIIMCQTSFLMTPLTYKLWFPQESKNVTTLFWYGLSLNIFVGNVIAITQQALWGRSLDYLEKHGTIAYQKVIREGLQREGMAAFFTLPKWFSRVLMNAPAQGTLPWFYNEVLPIGEPAFLATFQAIVYNRVSGQQEPNVNRKATKLKRTRTHYATLPTANPEFGEKGNDEKDR